MSNLNIEKNVMRRVRIIRFCRPMVSTQVLSLTAVLLALWGIGREVFVAQVFANMTSLSGLHAFMTFGVTAVLHTSVLVQVLLAVSVVAGAWFIASTLQTFRQGRAFA